MATSSCRANEPLASSTCLGGEMATCVRFPRPGAAGGRICSAASKGEATTMAAQLAVVMMAASALKELATSTATASPDGSGSATLPVGPGRRL